MISTQIIFEDMCFLEERYKNMQEIPLLEIFRVPSIRYQEVELNI